MKSSFRHLFNFVLKPFESGEEPYRYKPSYRWILNAMSVLFLGLAGSVLFFAVKQDAFGYFLPIVLFGGVGLFGLIIGLLGEDRAVAKVWGSR